MLAYFVHHIVTQTSLREAIWRISVCGYSGLFPAAITACAHDGPYSPWGTDAGTRKRGARGVFFPLASRIVRFVENEDFMTPFHNLSSDLMHALFAFTRTQEDD